MTSDKISPYRRLSGILSAPATERDDIVGLAAAAAAGETEELDKTITSRIVRRRN